MKLFVDESACIEALRSAALNRRQAMLLEFSVALAVFCDQDGAGMHDKKVLRQMYASVGYDCLKRSGADYVIIDHRVSAAALLYNKIGRRQISKWAGGQVDIAALGGIVKGLESMQLYTLKDIQLFVRGEQPSSVDGRKNRRKWSNENHPKRRQEDTVFAHVVEMPHVKVGVSQDATYAELKKAADELMKLANKVKMERNNLKVA